MPMSQDDKAKTAFISPLGLMQFTVIPFGLSGAPATFQRLMDKILAGLEHIAGVYLDDIIVYGDTWEEHIQNVQTVFERLQKADLTLKLKNCNFGVEDCVYLGHRVGKGGVRPEQTKIEAISKMPRPTTKKEVMSFLGIVSYYHRFIQHFAMKAEPLTALTKKGKPEKVIWTDQEQKSFQTLQADLSDSVMLINPDFNTTFQLQTDTSDVGVGSLLSQGGDFDQPITYFSRKLLDRERHYSTVEKECLAILLGIKAFVVYLLGKPFLLQTDNRALIWLQSM